MTSDGLATATIRLDRELPLVDVGARSGLLWSRDGLVLAGVGEAIRLPIDRPGGHGPAAAALAALAGRRELTVPGTGPLAFGALPFDPDRPGELIVPRIVAGANPAGQRWLTVCDAASRLDGDGLEEAVRIVDALAGPGGGPGAGPGGGQPAGDERPAPEPAEYRLRPALAPEVWRDEVVTPARDRIRAGELDKAVLARELVLETDQPIPVPAVVHRLDAAFPAAILFLVDGFVGASPELLVAANGDVVRAHPLAGTARRSTDPSVDQLRLGQLLASGKDRWEHRITIDWLLDRLLPFCSYVDAEPEPSIVTLANVHHLGTLVEGRLSQPSASILELVAALHPTPAVGGSPRKDALALIAELERADRGRYAGPVGWVDADGNGEFAVGIRSAELAGRRARFFAGVGVVADSDPDAELDETRAKLSAMLGALLVP